MADICRFLLLQRDEIYTNIGSILCSVNPYKSLPIYSASHVELYKHGAEAGPQALAALEPHIFAIAAEAYTKLYEEEGKEAIKHNQAVIISGESGAGQTHRQRSAAQRSVSSAATCPHWSRWHDADPIFCLVCWFSQIGKTEATKSVLQYLSSVAGSVSGVEQQVS